MRIFISYRQVLPPGRPSTYVASLFDSLSSACGHGDDVIMDVHHVQSRQQYATELIKRGLNLADALVVAIDDRWLEEKQVQRLLVSATADRSIDWVEYELCYASDHRMAVLIVGSTSNLSRFDAEVLQAFPYLAGAQRFAVDGTGFTKSDGRRVLAMLRQACKHQQRLPGQVRVGSESNADGRISQAEMQKAIRAFDPSLVYRGRPWRSVVVAMFWVVVLVVALWIIIAADVFSAFLFLCFTLVVWMQIDIGFRKHESDWTNRTFDRIQRKLRE